MDHMGKMFRIDYFTERNLNITSVYFCIYVFPGIRDAGKDFICQCGNIRNYCTEKQVFPLIEIYQNQEQFFARTLKTVPTVVFLALPGVAGLNAAEHLRSLYPKCGIIWCSDLDFSLHAFRLRIEYFFMKPVEEQKIKEGLSIWFECKKVR